MAMVSGVIDARPLSQSDFIQLRYGIDCSGLATTITDAEMADFTARHLKNYTHFAVGSLGLHHIAQLVNHSKPVIYDFKLNSNTQSHIVVMDQVEKTALLPDKRNISWIHVSDPWPVNQGNSYYITYERYYSQRKIADTDEDPERKYTISLLTKDRPNLDDNDNHYLSNVIFNENSDELVRAFLNNITASPDVFSDSFYEEVNFDKSFAAITKVSRGYRVLNVGNKGTIAEAGVKIETLLGMDADIRIYFLSQNNSIRTIITTARATNPHNHFGFEDNWIINHIERADRFQSMEFVLNKLEKDLYTAESNIL